MIDRRGFLALAAGTLLWPAAHARAADAVAGASDARLASALDKSDFVYVSPLRSDGAESTCHGELWFAHLDGAVVVLTAATSWKARALAKGLHRARIWVGNYGRWKHVLSHNEAFRSGPHFEARAETVKDDTLLERLLASYGEKYPKEISHWRDRMRAGYYDGSRVLVRYVPVRPSA